MQIDRVLIVGLGSIGKRHLRLAREFLPDADIRVLRHQATSDVPEYSNGCFSSIEEAIAFSPKIAIIANPATFHITTAQALAEVGVHLLIEKPLSASLEGGGELIETCRKQSLVLLTGYNLRFFPSLQCFRDFLREGVVGEILSVRCDIGQYLPSWRPDSDYRCNVSAKRELGGGALLELSHELDYLRWIFGEVDWVKATLTQQSRLEIDVEDNAHLIMGFLPTESNRQLIGVVNLDFIRHDTTRQCLAIGEKGSLRWNGLKGEVALYEERATDWRVLFSAPPQRDDSYVSQWENFVGAVRGLESPFITGEDGYAVLRIIDAAWKSAASGMQISVAHLPPTKRTIQ